MIFYGLPQKPTTINTGPWNIFSEYMHIPCIFIVNDAKNVRVNPNAGYVMRTKCCLMLSEFHPNPIIKGVIVASNFKTVEYTPW